MKYSVIIPYRNTFDLLVKAIGSVPDRQDIEVIVVDNGTIPVGSGSLPARPLLKYLTSDSTKGAGRARNVGLEAATGDHVLFLDADDRFAPGAFDTFDEWCGKGCDIVYFNVTSEKLADNSIGTRHKEVESLLDRYFRHSEEDALRYWYVTPWGKLFNGEFLRRGGFRFDEVPVSNDLMFSVRTGHAASSVSASREIVYIVTESGKNGSLTKTKSAENQFVRFKVAVSQYEFMESAGRPDMRFHLLSYVLHSLTDFGFGEFRRYLSYAREHKANIFLR